MPPTAVLALIWWLAHAWRHFEGPRRRAGDTALLSPIAANAKPSPIVASTDTVEPAEAQVIIV